MRVATATSRPPPPACSADTSPHSAHNVSPYDRVLDVAGGDHAAVVDEPGRADVEVGVGRVRPRRDLDRRRAQRGPVDVDHQICWPLRQG